MYPSAICRLSAPLAVSIFRASVAVAETTTVDAVRNVRCRRGDWRYVIHDGRKIVWPESRPRLSRLLPGEHGASSEFTIQFS
jgi:hypothetical protein